MWFKQIQIFKLAKRISFSQAEWLKQLEPLAFSPCLPSMPKSAGWVPPIDEENESLVRSLNGFTMLCMQLEEKILPSTVIRQALDDRIKKIEKKEERKCRRKEKQTLQDEVVMTLMPRAFTKFSRFYAYIDTEKQQLVLGTANAKATEQFLELFKKCVTDDLEPVYIEHASSIMTHWLQEQSYPSAFAIESACVLQDPSLSTRMVRCQQQDLFSDSMQRLIKDGFEAIQLSMNWFDRIKFVLDNKLVIRGIRFQEEVLLAAKDVEAETKAQRFDADFFMMTESFTQLLIELYDALNAVVGSRTKKERLQAVGA